jgi:hypothetical protein
MSDDTEHGQALTIAMADAGLLVIGDPQVVSTYTQGLRQRSAEWGEPLTVSDVADVAAASAAVSSVAASAGSYVQLSHRSMELLAQHQLIPGQTNGFFQGTVRGVHGRFAGTMDFRTVSLVANQAAALQLAAATVALRIAVENVQQAVARVEGKTDELLARARADQVGHVVAQHGVLSEMTAALDRTGSLPATDWDTVQHLGANVPGAIETLRRYVVSHVELLDPGASAQDRAKGLRRVVTGGQIGLMLQLLVLAEDSYYQWQRLRLERIQTVEPEHLADAITRANNQLAADLERDREIVGLLETTLTGFATQRPLEIIHPLAARNLQADASALKDDLAAFASARRMQIENWSEFTRPTVGDAAREIKARTAATGRLAIQQARTLAEEVGSTTSDIRRTVTGRAGDVRSRVTSLLKKRRTQSESGDQAASDKD